MTDPVESLERSLRDGPPDEAGYRDRRRELEIGFGATTGGVTPLQRVGAVRGMRRATARSTSMQVPITALIVTVLALGGVAFALRNNSIVTGPAATASASPSPASTTSATPVSSSRPSPIPTASEPPTRAAVTIPPLTQTFTSTRNGFSIGYPPDWTVTPATQSWPPNTFTQLGSPVLDQLSLGRTYRLVIASQRLSPGQTEAQWVSSYFPPFQGAMECDNATDLATAPRMPIDGRSGYLHLAGCPIYADSAMSPNDIMFEAFVFADDHVYQITLDGDVDLAFFRAILATMSLDPASAIDP